MSTLSTRPDPAPSRLKYRLERLMLTPLFWSVLKIGLPFALTFGVTSWWIAQEGNRQLLIDMVTEARSQVETRPEFMVNMMAIDGADADVSRDIRALLPIEFPVSSFDLDLEAEREKILALHPVKAAKLHVRQGNVLQIDITQRVPVVLWRTAQGLSLLDSDGVYIGPVAQRADHPTLPLIAGDGANTNIAEALALLEAARPLRDRLRGLVRVGERRWDIVLDRSQRIQLPETGAVQALERVIAMDHVADMLGRDLAVVDLRLPHRPTVRLTEDAVQTLWPTPTNQAGNPRE